MNALPSVIFSHRAFLGLLLTNLFMFESRPASRKKINKAAIEHIQKLLEQGRAKLQQDFDEWYGKCMHAEARHALQGAPTSAASAALAPATPAFAPAAPATAPAPTPASVSASSAAAPRAAHWAGEGLGGGGAGIALTGNKEADDDIVAFQRARDELYALQRRQQQMR